MGLMRELLGMIFGSGRNVIAETAEVFRENAEAGAGREARIKEATLAQFAAEFARPSRGLFDRAIDGLNRLPRPLLAFGCIGLMVAAMADPIWFAARMQGVALVPEPLWWLMGAVVSFYFGARHQAKGQDFQRSVAETMARAGQVSANLRALEALDRGATLAVGEGEAPARPTAPAPPPETGPNPALQDWRASR